MQSLLANGSTIGFLLAEELDYGVAYPHSWFYTLFSAVYPFAFLVFGALWLWMLIDCLRNDEDRQTWMWILIILSAPGALAYFFIRWLPRQQRLQKSMFGWLTRGRKIGRLQAAAHHIGNPHQYVELGEALREANRLDEARVAFRKALDKDGGNLPARWGAAQVELTAKDYVAAREHLKVILDSDVTYKFGDVSLAYGRVLAELKETPQAREHLERHLSRWTHPEAIVRLAVILVDQGETGPARTRLEGLLLDMQASPRYFIRQNSQWTSQAKRLLKTIPS